MAVINTNTGSLYAQQSLNINARGLATVMQQLSTGKRINNAVDDVAGMAISTRLTSQIRGLNQAVRNANDGISLLQTAEGATEQVTNLLQRMRELAVQSSNDTNNDRDRGFLDGEFQQLRNEIDRIGQNTQWNGANILDGTGGINLDGKFAFQVGANSRQTIEIELPNMQTGGASDPAVTLDAASVDATTGVATLDFTAFDTTTPSSYLGVTIQATVGNKAVQYQITEADIASVADAASPLTEMSEAIANGIKTKLEAAYGTTGDTYTVTESSGVLTVTPTGDVDALDDAGAGQNVKIEEVVGKLSAIGGSLDITSAENAYTGLQAIDTALQVVNAARSTMGAIVSRLQFAQDNLANVAAKAQESRSRIEDTDYAIATTELAKRNIIQQAAQAMLAQANQAPQLVLQLLK